MQNYLDKATYQTRDGTMLHELDFRTSILEQEYPAWLNTYSIGRH